MYRILTHFVRLSALKGHPQDLPVSQFIVVGTTTALFVVYYLRSSLSVETTNPFEMAVAYIIFLGLTWALMLKFFDHTDRWHQSICALFGSNAIVILITTLFLFAHVNTASLRELGEDDISPMLVFGIVAWQIAVTGRIIRDTLKIDFWKPSGTVF